MKRKASTRYKAWECSTCGKMLGITYPNGVLAIKHKEFYCWVVGQCKVVCRYCSAINVYNTTIKLQSEVDLNNIFDDIDGIDTPS
jgi:hypothetical protein